MRGSSAAVDAVEVDPLDPAHVAVGHQAQRAARRVLAAVAVLLQQLRTSGCGDRSGSSRTNLMKCSSPGLRTLRVGSTGETYGSTVNQDSHHIARGRRRVAATRRLQRIGVG